RVQIGAGERRSLARGADGTVWTWGANESGELGNGTLDASSQPVQVIGLTGVVSIAAGDRHSLAVLEDGSVWGWGQGGSWQLGGAGLAATATPVQLGRNVCNGDLTDFELFPGLPPPPRAPPPSPPPGAPP